MAYVSNARQPIPPGKRRRLQQCFEHGSGSAAKGGFDYAVDMFTQCVIGDPANQLYVQSFLKTLYQKYNNNKKGAGMLRSISPGQKTAITKASMKKDWPAVIAPGLEMLKLNPWDVSTLKAMAVACDAMEFPEAQLVYLKGALEVDGKDAEVNRLCGRALARVGRFDEAIACWHRVEQAKPADEEARRAIGNLAVEKTIHHGGYEDAQSSTDVKSDRNAESTADIGPAVLTPEQRLEKAIKKTPAEIALYVELSDLHTRNERFAEAEAVLERALEASGGDLAIRERLEETRLRTVRTQLATAERRAKENKTDEAKDLAKRIKNELNQLELEFYRDRSERYPQQLGLKYELGVRLKRAGNFSEAINFLQSARGDTKRRAIAHLELGECFQQIKQYKLSMDCYETAIQEIPERELEHRKLALYRAGTLALGMAIKGTDKSPEVAENLVLADKYLSQLAGVDFAYRDIAKLLDKVAEMRNKG